MSNLLEKASILTTPTAYNDGKILSVKPAPSLGSELVTNGDFATDSDWIKGSGWSIANGVATLSATDGSSSLSSPNSMSVTSGRKYEVKINVLSTSSGFRLYDSYNVLSYGLSLGLNTFYVTMSSASYSITPLGLSNSTGSIDNVSVKEAIDADLDFTRGSAATRVNAQGLIENVDALGSELITNGDFATDSDWTKAGLATIGSGAANFVDGGANTYSYIRQNISQEVGKSYQVTFEIKNYVSGGLQLLLEGQGAFGNYSANGTYTVTLNSPTLNGYIEFSRNFSGGTFSFSIDNVSVKEAIDADLDFTRGSTATRVNSSGLIEDVASGLPRIDYTDGVGSILLEPQSTNIVPYSEDFENSAWNKIAATITPNNTISPDGTQNSDLFVPNSSGGQIYDGLGSKAASAISYATSLYVKPKGLSSLRVYLHGISNADRGDATFNLSNQTVSFSNNGAFTNTSASILSVGNGWYRCILVTTSDTSTTLQLVIRYDGSVDNISGLNLWGCQTEQGSYATSLIPTSGTVQTRLAETASNAGSSDLINSSEGVLYFEASTLLNGGRYMTISINDGSSSNHISFLYRIQENQVWMQTSGSGTATNINIYDVVQNINNKIALSYSANGIKLFINGLLKGSISINALPIGLNSVEFNNGAQGEKFYGKTKCVAVFKEALTDAELTCLTTI